MLFRSSAALAPTAVAVKDWSLIRNPTAVAAEDIAWDPALKSTTILFNSSDLKLRTGMPGTGPETGYAKHLVFNLTGNVEGGNLTVKIDLAGTQIIAGLESDGDRLPKRECNEGLRSRFR